MNDLAREHDQVIAHLERLAGEAASTIDVPPAPVARHLPGAGRRWVLPIVAAAAVVMAVAVEVIVGGRDGIDTVDMAETVPPSETAPYAPTEWPAALDSDIQAPRFLDGFPVENLQLLELDGSAAALAAVLNVPIGQPANPISVELTVGSQAARWSRTATGVEHLSVAVAPGQTLTLSSRTIGRPELIDLVQGFDDSRRVMTDELLPNGWAVGDDTADLAGVLANYSGPRADWSSVERTQQNGAGALRFSTRRVADARGAVDQAAQFGGATVQRWEVNGADAVLIPGDGTIEEPNQLFWAPTRSTLVIASGVEIEPDELVDTARSASQMGGSDWANLLARAEDDGSKFVDGFRLQPDDEVVQTGLVGTATWMVTQSPPQSGGLVPGTTVMVHLRDDNGSYGGSGSTPGGAVSGVTYARIGPYVVLQGWVPVGTNNVALELEGKKVDLITVQAPGRTATLVFAILDGIRTGYLDPAAATITGTLDGAEFRSPPMTAEP